MKRAFINGKFYISAGQFAQAVLIEDGVFTLVGTNDDIKAASDGCEFVDLKGRTVLPGFNDSHMHLYKIGVTLASWDMFDCTALAQCIREGREYIAKNNIPAGRLVAGYRWNQDYFTDEPRILTRHDLDLISTEHPVIAYRACVHLASCNSLALKMAGINSATPDVSGGEIRKDENGEPNGILTEYALALLDVLKTEPTVEEMAATLKSAMTYANSHGITSIQPNDIRNENAQAMFDAYNVLYKRGEATLRVNHQCCFTDISGLKGFIAAGRRMGEGDDMLKIGPIKMFIDGSLGAHTAALRSPYEDDPGVTGIYCMTAAELDEMVQTAHNAGFGCVIHAIGDGGIDRVLSSYEKVVDGGQNLLRHAIIHCQITDAPILERLRKSDVLAHVQPIFLNYDIGIAEKRVGKQLAQTSYAFNTMNKMGIHVSYGTDAPIEDLSTMNNLHCAINRQDLDGYPPGGFYPEECVPLADAIDNYTIKSAYASFDEKRKGRIAPGFLADMCVLNTDIFAADPAEIRSIKIDMTVLGGETVWKDN